MLVWAHHMFSVGLPTYLNVFFMLSSMTIAVPTGIKIFNWIATTWRSNLIIFPAEDGIRGRDVTGVQTCALPILSEGKEGFSLQGWVVTDGKDPPLKAEAFFPLRQGTFGRILMTNTQASPAVAEGSHQIFTRSEERRVRKACGAWCVAEPRKKKQA